MKKKMLSLIFIIFFLRIDMAFASNADTPPSGIKIENIFQTPEGADSSIIKYDSVDIVEVTGNKKNQSGAIWNTENNMMDLTNNFETSMYLYFGDKGKDAADGMAFVMQADPNGNKAFRTGDGARLGVWDSTNPREFGKAINNSLAIEFDTYYNSGFDDYVATGRNHIAWNYPGDKNSYVDSLFNRVLKHNNIQYPINKFLSDDSWHSFKLSWDVRTSLLTYKFDSLASISIKINPDEVFKTSQVYWGFTGSTGGSYATNRVVFEQVPGLVEGGISEEIVDKDTGVSVFNDHVVSEATLTHSIDVTYQHGKQDWKEVSVMKTLNDNLQYVPGSLRLIDIYGNEIMLPDSHWSGNELNILIGDMGLTSNQKKVIFDAKVKPVSIDTEVNESVIAKGQNYISYSDDFNYTIISNTAPMLTLEGSGQETNVDDGIDIEIRGTWLDKNSETVSLYYQLNENSPVLFEENSPNTPKDRNHNYSVIIPSSELAVGQNVLKIWGVDIEGTKSNVEMLNIDVKGILRFVNIPNFDFGNFSIPLKNKFIFQINNETIKLSDTRGIGSKWELKVKVKKPFTSIEGNVINSFYYIDKDNKMNLLQVNELVLIDTGITKESSIQEIVWASDQGLALEVMPSNYIGKYSSELEWILEDTPTS